MTFDTNLEFTNADVRSEIENTKSTDVLLLLLDLLESVTRSITFDELLGKVGKASQKLMQVEATSVMLLDDTNAILEIVMATGPVRGEVLGKKIPANHGYAGWVVENKQPVFVNDIQKGGLFDGEISNDFETANLICVPLFDHDKKLIGVLEALNRPAEGSFSKADIPIFQTLANHTARSMERISSKDEVSKLLEQQDLFYREIHHRVKNDFALISGLVEMENIETTDGEVNKTLLDVQSRIHTMASVYDILTGSDLHSSINARDYFEELTSRLADNLSNPGKVITVETDVESFIINPSSVIYCGLIINELMINSFKHAFTGRKEGRVYLCVTNNDDIVHLTYRDDGKGISEDFDLEQSDSLGFEIIGALVGQLDAEISVKNEDGAVFDIRFDA